MKMMVTVVPLLVAVIIGAQPGAASTHAAVASVSTFLDDHASLFLDHVKGHFDKSLTYLFTGNAFGDQAIQRPGLAKVLREESDRHWNLGIAGMKKYMQRGGKTPAASDTSTQANIFKNKFSFQGNNTLSTINKDSPDFANTYLLQCANLVTDCRTTVVQVNDLHRMAMKRTGGNHGDFDADMGHYLEEKIGEEVGLMRKFSNLHTSLEKMKDLGLAQHIFDKTLLD